MTRWEFSPGGGVQIAWRNGIVIEVDEYEGIYERKPWIPEFARFVGEMIDRFPDEREEIIRAAFAAIAKAVREGKWEDEEGETNSSSPFRII